MMKQVVFKCKEFTCQIDRIARVAFETARKRHGKLCSVDKANVLEVLCANILLVSLLVMQFKGFLGQVVPFFISVIIYGLDYHMQNECGFLVEVLKPIHQKYHFSLDVAVVSSHFKEVIYISNDSCPR